MRKVFAILLYVVAGFFIYVACLLAFVSEPSPITKWGIVAGFTMPAALSLGGGLALTRFKNWRRDSAVVFLSASGFTAFLVFTILCLLMTDDFRRMMQPDTLRFFNAYIFGGSFVIVTGALGLALLKTAKQRAEPANPPYSEPAARSPQG